MKQLRAAIAVMMAALMLILTACNDAETPEQAIKGFNSKMNDCSYKAAFAYVADYDGLSFDKGDKNGTKQIVDAVAKTLDIDIIDIQTSGAMGVATLNITTVDLRQIYSKAAAAVTNGYVDDVLGGSKISAEEMRDALVAEIVHECETATSDEQRVQTECTVNMKKEKDHWYMILDSTSFNVMMGYINDANTMVESGDFSSFTPVSDSDVSSAESDTGEDNTGSEEITFND